MDLEAGKYVECNGMIGVVEEISESKDFVYVCYGFADGNKYGEWEKVQDLKEMKSGEVSGSAGDGGGYA